VAKRVIVIAVVVAALAVVFLIAMKAMPQPKPVPVVAASQAAAVTDGADAIMRKADSALKSQDFIAARDGYRKVIEQFPNSNLLGKAQEALDNANIALIFSSVPTDDSFIYEVRKGDTLTRIAKDNSTTVELVSRANGLKSSAIRAGQKLKVNKAKYDIIVDKSQNILTLKSGDTIVKTYRVSTGKNSCTPTGTFKIVTKIIDPPWYPQGGGMIPSGDPKNVLGSRWLGLSKPSYGIHGTIDPGSIGQSVTDGCVRMKNADVEELYAIVPEGTQVVIAD
jgi:lipoprotein-anchoring transpeptidase ErfK/SrfK